MRHHACVLAMVMVGFAACVDGEGVDGMDIVDTSRLEMLAVAGGIHDDRIVLSGIVDIAVLQGDTIAVLDGMPGQIIILDPSLQLVRVIELGGDGPGGVIHAVALESTTDGGLAILDAGRKVVLLSPSGELEGEALVRFRVPLGGDPGLRVLGSGDSLLVGIPFGDTGGWEGRTPIYEVIRRDGIVLDTVWVQTDVLAQCVTGADPDFRAGYLEDIRAFYLPRLAAGVLDDGTVVAACTGESRVLFQQNGESRASVSVPASAGPVVSEREARDFEALLHAELQYTHPDFRTPSFPIPDRRPPIEGVLATDGGRLAVVLSQPNEPVPLQTERMGFPAYLWLRTGGARVILFDSSGAEGESFRLPDDVPWTAADPRSVGPIIKGGRVWTVSLDAGDVPVIRSYQLVDLAPAAREGSGGP